MSDEEKVGIIGHAMSINDGEFRWKVNIIGCKSLQLFWVGAMPSHA